MKKLLYLCTQIQETVQHSTQIPEIAKLQNFNHFSWHCTLQEEGHELLTLAKIEGELPDIPENFMPPTYALEFVECGTIKGVLNHQPVKLMANSCAFYMADSLLQRPEVSADCVFYILGFTTQFAEKLNLLITQNQLSQVLIRPVWQISEQQMQTVKQYIALIRTLIDQNYMQAVYQLMRSLLHFLAQNYHVDVQSSHSISRAEQICGQYFSLVELHCREQHSVEWYASQMCLSPKYLSNVVKQTLGASPNKYIDEAITRQAKSLLSSTSLSVQQISDRLGFQNQSHFGTFFKRQTGQSPKAFKREGEIL